MTHGILVCLLAVTAVIEPVRALAELVPPAGETDTRIRAVPYAADQVYRLHGYVGYVIHIELETGEEFLGLGAGDAEAITVDVSGSNVFLKPRALPLHTNITLLTTRRQYQFDYSASDAPPNPGVDDVIYSLSFSYPTLRVDPADDKTQVRDRNLDYWYCGHRSLKPVATFDDGVHTHIRFSPKGEIPVIFVRNEDGSESLLNFSIDASAGEIVIHRLAPSFVLRRGRLSGCIVNHSYAGSGERLPSGAVKPDVTRRLWGERR